MTMNIKFLASAVSLALITTLSPVANAAGNGYGPLDGVSVANGVNYASIQISGAGTIGHPACQTGGSTSPFFGFDISTNKGKAMLSLAQAAQLAGKVVSVAGTGACITVGTGLTYEGLASITVITNG